MLYSSKRTQRFLASVSIVAFLALVAMAAPPPGKGKPSDGEDPPPTPLPDFAFSVQFIRAPTGFDGARINYMNNRLQAVGEVYNATGHVGFLYNANAPSLLTLPDLISSADLIALSADGWSQSQFRGVNENGLIAGRLQTADSTAERGFILDTNTTPATMYYPDENPAFSQLGITNYFLDSINDNGYVVGHFGAPGESRTPFVLHFDAANATVSNLRQLGGLQQFSLTRFGHRKITNDGLIFLRGREDASQYDILTKSLSPISTAADDWNLTGVTESGNYYGDRQTNDGRKLERRPIHVAHTGSAWEIVWERDIFGSTQDINSQGDVVTAEREGRQNHYAWHTFLYQQPTLERLRVSELIDPADPLLSEWLQTGVGEILTEPQFGTGVGAIASRDWAWILLPKDFPRN